ncbi:MAG: glycosyltransferase family 2 protein [Spirochaetaceae bacterium]|jgi:glycosyltransferase involved in cell wall biosynthesis|nr:glycosyltransferase family 2 protein [Spirochaetaceae bacterium]
MRSKCNISEPRQSRKRQFAAGYQTPLQMNYTPLPATSIVVPCYNDEEVLPETAKRLLEKLKQLRADSIVSENSKIVLVDDGSSDKTWEVIQKLYLESPESFCGIKLSKNCGHQNALVCGLLFVKDCYDAAISIDSDLQDDISIIDNMLRKYREGYEIVYGVRSDRNSDSVFKRVIAQCFYGFMRLLGVDIVYNHADFRLMGRKALEALSEYSEVNLFLRGIVPLLGFKTGVEYYSLAARFAGKSHYSLSKKLKFALEGITSFSIQPIRMITLLGILMLCASVIMIIYFFTRHFSGDTVRGWPSMIVSLWGIGGLILFAVGIIGEYIGKIYLEVKHRPRYIIEATLRKS